MSEEANSGGKRKLGLLSEILPDPTPSGGGSPRQRTLATMNRLGAMAATVAMLQGCSQDGGGSPAYGVVDPMPPPAQCAGVASSITATAKWKAGENGAFTVEVTLSKPGRADAAYTPGDPSNVYGGKVTGTDIKPDAVKVTLTKDPESKSLYFALAATCQQGAGHVALQLDLSAPPTADAEIPVTLTDSW